MAKPLIGEVIKLSDPKTAIVQVNRTVIHPLYQKRYSRRQRFLVDQGGLTLTPGQKVAIIETRPLSRKKHHLVTKILSHDSTPDDR